MELRTKYLAGWHTSENMKQQGLDYHNLWTNSASKAEEDGMQLVVFAIPVSKTNAQVADPETVEEIEKLLQDKFCQ